MQLFYTHHVSLITDLLKGIITWKLKCDYPIASFAKQFKEDKMPSAGTKYVISNLVAVIPGFSNKVSFQNKMIPTF